MSQLYKRHKSIANTRGILSSQAYLDLAVHTKGNRREEGDRNSHKDKSNRKYLKKMTRAHVFT
jgi:hypothetical protein